MGLFSAIGSIAGFALGGPTGAAIGGAIGGGLDSSKAASKAASAQSDSAKYAADLQNMQYQQTREDFAPWRNIGGNALQMLAGTYGITEDGIGKPNFSNFFQSPGYKFRLSEGNKALDRSAAARGMLLSGNQLKALSRYNQGMASDEFGNWTNRLAALAGVGQSATGATASAGANAASNQGNALMQAGNARASGYIGKNNALVGGINNAIGALGYGYGGYQQPYAGFLSPGAPGSVGYGGGIGL